ncbi:hypothetical protein GCM10007421_33240 [Halopseudomonas oceani]|uniref:DUF1145 domain-containing protein n=1 Tax=Halopseudomonas oceani TaxID=1708783 RepID=A0A2P4ERW0_9GAMM|nr:DUF1145 domain-containing protein [Halopseudomonas oceani]POB01526.1 hypothetical protein C1949_16210 [Halopseudomonas oceani]GGE56048.1 hypothetical protein GCM10007421_33240 [Halopseudomonas oceani]
MRASMLVGKLLMLVFWLTVILSLFGLVPVPNPQRLQMIALIVLGVHVLECLLTFGKLKKTGALGVHLVQVMLFGVLHLRHPDTVQAMNQAL